MPRKSQTPILILSDVIVADEMAGKQNSDGKSWPLKKWFHERNVSFLPPQPLKTSVSSSSSLLLTGLV